MYSKQRARARELKNQSCSDRFPEFEERTGSPPFHLSSGKGRLPFSMRYFSYLTAIPRLSMQLGLLSGLFEEGSSVLVSQVQFEVKADECQVSAWARGLVMVTAQEPVRVEVHGQAPVKVRVPVEAVVRGQVQAWV